ncbi:hypothetical protein [Bradyrhizobium lablabi]|nr:hypothetical protein [Bradyrhizobium lablabi]
MYRLRLNQMRAGVRKPIEAGASRASYDDANELFHAGAVSPKGV